MSKALRIAVPCVIQESARPFPSPTLEHSSARRAAHWTGRTRRLRGAHGAPYRDSLSRIYQLPSVGGMSASERLARSADALHLRFDPRLDFAIECVCAAARTGRRRADGHCDGARVLEEAVARPDTPRVVRDRDHRDT